MEDCEETIFDKGETIETNVIKEEPPANKKEENQIKKGEKDCHCKHKKRLFLFSMFIINKNIIN